MSPEDHPTADLEPPIRAMIDATNRGDTPAFLDAFSEDAVLTDWGRIFKGKTAIRRWNSDENIGTRNKMRVTGVERAGHDVKVTVMVSGGGYNGLGELSFELEAGLIKRLTIS